jgi:putative membrane protein
MNRRHMLTAGAALAATLPLVGAARAQTSALLEDGSLDPSKAPVILGGNFAKLTSQVALERAQSDAVRQFAELEVAEQTAVGQAFSVPADAPPQLTEDKAAMLEELQNVDAAMFDMMYIDGQIMGHEELRAAAVAYASGGDDPMAMGGALVAVTGIDTHLVMLRAMRAMMAG